MVQEVVDDRKECGQLGPDAGAEVACRRPEFGSGSVRPLDEGSGSAVSDHSVHRLVRWAAGRVTSAEVSRCRALIDRLKMTWGHAAISHGGGRLGRRAGALSEGYPSGLPGLAPDLPPARHRLQTVSRARLCNLPPSWPVVYRQVFLVFQDFRVFRVTRVFRRGLWLQLRLCHNSMDRVESERPIIILATLRIFRSNNSTRPGELRATRPPLSAL